MKKMIVVILGLMLAMAEGAPVKSILSAREISSEEPIQKHTAKDYIQDGLIAMWDGIENAGWGVHDPAATVWKDLTDNGDAILVGNPLFNDTSIYFDNTSYATSISRVGLKSIELVVNIPTTEAFAAFSIDPTQSSPSFSSYTLTVYDRFGWGFLTKYYNFGYYSSTINGKHVFSYVSGIGEYVDAQFGNKHNQYPNIGSGAINIATTKVNKDVFHGNCSIFAIRLYSRVLTDTEIAYNYKIDKARFNLP